jgi:hypothetical protein
MTITHSGVVPGIHHPSSGDAEWSRQTGQVESIKNGMVYKAAGSMCICSSGSSAAASNTLASPNTDEESKLERGISHREH